MLTRRVVSSFWVGVSFLAIGGASATGGIVAAATPGGLDAFMGMPLLAVTDDGTGLGTIYGHPPTLTPGMALATPIGDMGFGPSHERVALGTATSSGAFMAIPGPGPIAGSTVYAPVGATAMDFFISGAGGAPHTFEITAVGSLTSTTIIVAAGAVPTYVGFGATGETIDFYSIVKLPFPSPTTVTWVVEDIRVLPAPGAGAALLSAALVGVRRRR